MNFGRELDRGFHGPRAALLTSDAITYCFSCPVPVQFKLLLLLFLFYFFLAENASSAAHYITSPTGMMVTVQLFVDTHLGYTGEISNSFMPQGGLSVGTGREIVNKRTGKKSTLHQEGKR